MSDQPVKRMRVFAGPNGSGKSTIIKEIQKKVRTGIYINADDIEKSGTDKGFINLGDFGLESTPEHFNQYLQSSTLVSKARSEIQQMDLSLSDNIIRINNNTNSYEAALIADYLRKLLLERNEIFSFETVMSHPSKLDTLQQAHEKGYKNYLYFISTESPDINIQRVLERVKKGGHAVDPNKIAERYIRSMKLLSTMIPYCHRCFIFDNSLESGYRLIAEIVDGKEIISYIDGPAPAWVETYVLRELGV